MFGDIYENTDKDKIFDVALDLFSKKGYDSVSIRTIASEVGIKESSIYNHYSSKRDFNVNFKIF